MTLCPLRGTGLLTIVLAWQSAIAAQAADLAAYAPPPSGSVKIIRDRYGVPHIIAADEPSLFYGVGYAQAEDQLENVAENFLRAAGRSAEFEGPGALNQDHLIRALGVPERSEEQYRQLSDELCAQLDAYAAGLNAYRQEHRDELPDWIEPARPQDVLAFYNYVEVQFGVSDCQGDLRKAGVRVAALSDVPDRHELAYGSNQFAVSPRRSATGTAQLSMDPHLPLSGFFRWYEMHLVSPQVNVMGCCFFGSPYISMGRTPSTAWCMTVNAPDLGDVFAFDIKADDPTQYRDLDGWQKFADAQETFKVLRGDKLEEVRLPIRRTSLGPVMATADGRAYVYAFPWHENANRATQIMNMARATNVDEFRKALETLGLVMFNIVYADAHGDIFYISNGRIPRRDQRIDSHAIRPGHEAWARWQGFHPLADMPQVLNPPCGYVMNTNSGPHNVCPDVAPQASSFPPYVFGQEANSRSLRLRALLDADQEITWEELHDYATDTKTEALDRLVPKLVERIEQQAGKSPRDADRLREIAGVLKAWDRHTELNSQGGVLFMTIFADGAFPAALDQDDFTAGAQAVLKAADAVSEKFEKLDAPWSEFSRIRRGEHELGIAGNGSRDSRLAQFTSLRPTYGVVHQGRRYATGGTSYAMVVDFSCGGRSMSCLPFGVSDREGSKHFADQLPLYAKKQYKPAWFTPEEIGDNTESEVVLKVLGD
ncbi:MAG: penicillin acylase family protein [Pirellulales bacterium]